MTKYAVMVPSFVEDSWIYVVSTIDNRLKTMTFDTYEEAEESSKIWKIAKVVEYESGN
jgi:hypothetical protein